MLAEAYTQDTPQDSAVESDQECNQESGEESDEESDDFEDCCCMSTASEAESEDEIQSPEVEKEATSPPVMSSIMS